MPVYPLCEVFGYPADNFSDEATNHRFHKMCPYNNRVSKCTKVSVTNPLGVCSMWMTEKPIIICPVRFRQNWQVVKDTTSFLLPNAARIDFVTEASLHGADGNEAGSIDVVLVDYEEGNKVVNFGALELQSVYITGNIRNPFSYYIQDPESRHNNSWSGDKPPRPDWLSSVKRLVRQLTVKGAILNTWGKKMAIAVESQFYQNIPVLNGITEVTKEKAELGWFLYSLIFNAQTACFELQLERTIYMTFEAAIERFSTLQAGDIQEFTNTLQKKLLLKSGKNKSRP